MAKEKIVELSLEDFQAMVTEIRELRVEVDQLKTANEYLNAQIHDYNQKIANQRNADGNRE